MSRKIKPTLAAANQFTPVTKKNIEIETPIRFLRIDDLNTPKNQLYPSPMNYDTEVFHSMEDDTDIRDDSNFEFASLSELKAILLKALKVVEILEKREKQEQTKAEKRSYHYHFEPEKETWKDILANKQESENCYEQKGKSNFNKKDVNRKIDEKSAIEDKRPNAQEKQNYRAKEKPENKYISDKMNQIKYSPQTELRSEITDSSIFSDYLSGLGSTGIHSNTEGNCYIGSDFHSSDDTGKNLQERMHQMSIILKNLEMQLDELHPQI